MSMISGGVSIDNLCKSFGATPVLQHLSLAIRPKESMALVGPSGSGKSVLMRCILGLSSWQKGSITLGPYSIVPETQKEHFAHCAVVFQSYALLDSLSVAENITFGLTQRKSPKEVHDLLEIVGLPKRVEKLYPDSLSGGMKRRVAMARALARRPSFLFLDEPTEGLDPVLSYEISLLIKTVVQELQATTLTITHDVRNAFLFAQRIAVLNQGAIVWCDTPQAMRSSQEPTVRSFVQRSFDAQEA